jgi:hypothetical protein
MNKAILIGALLVLSACTSKSPSACACAKNLQKSNETQDAALLKRCNAHINKLNDSAQEKWFLETMDCLQK